LKPAFEPGSFRLFLTGITRALGLLMFKLIPTVRGGATNSALVAARFATIDDARAGAKQLMHENGRVVRIMIVREQPAPQFAEWVERA
jgi:hypothetical protein